MTAELNNYIIDARKKNLTDAQIKDKLTASGWSEASIKDALSSTEMPVPPQAPVAWAAGLWTGFLHILYFFTLYILLISVAGVFHYWVDKLAPATSSGVQSSLDYFYSFNFLSDVTNSDAISLLRGYISLICISFPVFIFIAIKLRQQQEKLPTLKNIRIRKILIYLTLFISFLILFGVVASTIYDLLSADFSGNVFGHTLVTVLIGGSLFAYFFIEVSDDKREM